MANPSPNPMMNFPAYQSPSTLFRMQQILSQQQQQFMQQMSGLPHSQTMPFAKSSASSVQPSPRGGAESANKNGSAWQNNSMSNSATFPSLTSANNNYNGELFNLCGTGRQMRPIKPKGLSLGLGF